MATTPRLKCARIFAVGLMSAVLTAPVAASATVRVHSPEQLLVRLRDPNFRGRVIVLGYGVHVGSGGYATIEYNVFDFNRHAVTSDGWAHSGYELCASSSAKGDQGRAGKKGEAYS